MKLMLIMVILVLGMANAHGLSEIPGDETNPSPIVEPTVDPLPVSPSDPELPDDCGVRS